MPKAKKKNTVQLSEDMNRRFDSLPIPKAAAIVLSINQAWREPDTLALAFRFRLSQPQEEVGVKVSYTVDDKMQERLQKLMSMTKLSGEQVVRLAMEAYIHRL